MKVRPKTVLQTVPRTVFGAQLLKGNTVQKGVLMLVWQDSRCQYFSAMGVCDIAVNFCREAEGTGLGFQRSLEVWRSGLKYVRIQDSALIPALAADY